MVTVGGRYIPPALAHQGCHSSENKKKARILGAIVGAAALTYVANQEFINSPSRSAGVTVLKLGLSALGGGLAGLLAGSAVSNVSFNARVIRPMGLALQPIYFNS